MGIFDKFKVKKESHESRKERLKAILSDLTINPYDFDHSRMELCEISLQDELEGVIKMSDLTFEQGEKEFDYVCLYDKKDGTKLLYLGINNRDERETRNLVDKFSSRLGPDFLELNEFTAYDLSTMTEEDSGHLRTWHLTYFEVIIGFLKRDYGNSTFILVTEKNYT